MNVIQRTRNAIRGANAGWRYPSKAARGRRSRTVLLWPDWRNRQAQWVLTDLSSYVQEGFELNAVIYSAIMYKVRTAYAAVLRAYKGTRDEPELLPAGSELGNLLDRPNPHQSFPELQSEAMVYFNLFGDSYVWFKRKAGEMFPLEFYCLRPDRVMHLYETGSLRGYVFVPKGMAVEDGIPLLPGDVMHVRLPNPADPYQGLGKGLSPIRPLAQSGDVDNAATSFLKLFFDQGAMPMGMFTTSGGVPFSPTEVDEVREVFLAKYGNWQQWTEPMFLSGDARYEKIGASFDDLDLTTLDARNESRIAMPFGVPLTLIETRPALVQSTYSNKQTDYKMFLDNTLIPELQMFEQEWRYFLRSEDGKMFAQYDYMGIPGWFDKAKYIEDVGNAYKFGAVTRATYKQALGLPVDDSDEVYLLSMTQTFVPAGGFEEEEPPAVAPQTEAGAAGAEEEEEGAKALNGLFGVPALVAGEHKADDPRLALARQVHNVAARWEPAAMKAAQAAFRADRREIAAIVDEAQRMAYHSKATLSWTLALTAVTGYLNNAGKANWRASFGDVLSGVALAQGETLSLAFKQDFDAETFLTQEWFGQYQMIFADPLTDTSEREIAAIFEQAAAEGWSVPQMQDTLGDLFDQWIDGDVVPAADSYFAEQRLPPWRAEMIARTEMMRASNATAENLYRNWGVAEKEWLAALDDRTRPEHAVAHGQRVGIDDVFEVGGERLRFPGDPQGSPGNTINCRCTVIPRGMG